MKNLSTVLNGEITALKESIASFIFPSHCIHCDEKIESRKFLCSSCADQLEFIDATGVRKSATLEPLGSALSFRQAAKGPLAEEVAKTISAYMVIQWQRLKWPLPDIIIPSPKDPFNLLLSKHLSIFLGVSTLQALKFSGFFSPRYQWKATPYLSDQRLLVIDILMPDLKELAILEEACPKEIFYLSLLDL
ncbi:MAG: double zinc ribbon domain-containing protein [Chlamydiota bacterium]